MIYRFVDGAEWPAPPDMAVVRAVLEPHDVGDPQRTVGEDGTTGFRVRAADGSEAEIFVDQYGIHVERPHAGGVFGIVAELVSRLGAVVIDPARAGIVCRAEEQPHLPPDMREGAVVIEMTGEALEAALTGPRRA
ncbi:hypothetical protein DEJ50_14255 [Streptomyces venezuelae]|uniref:Uncharacterized protein n=1 Tax=Streptomyces venezuelae TaxID=54571 RepID=A0A5P2D2N2_STRVZ|nr:hypothetical protein [Streptomyces venezuelae]QES48810.1 hypothetical protein DEJ50_14255 [Streptomyces venezuelae]